MQNLIELKNICKTYENRVEALKNINLTIKKGELIAIIGSSGSGKSTLMNILGCLDTPTSGEYYLDNQDVSTLSENKLSEIRNKKIGFVFQGFNLINDLTAVENVELPLLYRGFSKEKRRALAIDILNKMGLSERLHHKPCEMSGGQQQRVAIARAVAGNPPVILADEPTGNLDSKTGENVMSLLSDLHRDGKTVIIITHDLKIASFAERVVKISDGQIY